MKHSSFFEDVMVNRSGVLLWIYEYQFFFYYFLDYLLPLLDANPYLARLSVI